MKKKRNNNTGSLQTILVGFAINKLIIAKYGKRRFVAVNGTTVNTMERDDYLATYKENSIAGREELRTDLAKQLTKKSKAWFKNNPLRSMQLVNAARSITTC